MLEFLIFIFLVGAVLILDLGYSTAYFIPVSFDGFINPFLERVLSNIQLTMIVIGAFVGSSLGLDLILCAKLGCLP